MPKLYSYTFMSVDGVVSSPERWVAPYFTPELGQDLAGRLMSAEAMVLGRSTYQEFAEFWPGKGSDVPFADLNNNIKKYVVSRTLRSANWKNSSIVSAEELGRLKGAGNLHITGSGQLVRSLLEQGLLDEIIILQFPVVLGTGHRILEGIAQTGLALVQSKSFPAGVQRLSFTKGGSANAA